LPGLAHLSEREREEREEAKKIAKICATRALGGGELTAGGQLAMQDQRTYAGSAVVAGFQLIGPSCRINRGDAPTRAGSPRTHRYIVFTAPQVFECVVVGTHGSGVQVVPGPAGVPPSSVHSPGNCMEQIVRHAAACSVGSTNSAHVVDVMVRAARPQAGGTVAVFIVDKLPITMVLATACHHHAAHQRQPVNWPGTLAWLSTCGVNARGA
jgi:hypothetical protein